MRDEAWNRSMSSAALLLQTRSVPTVLADCRLEKTRVERVQQSQQAFTSVHTKGQEQLLKDKGCP
jgi:hypothetical protein